MPDTIQTEPERMECISVERTRAGWQATFIGDDTSVQLRLKKLPLNVAEMLQPGNWYPVYSVVTIAKPHHL